MKWLPILNNAKNRKSQRLGNYLFCIRKKVLVLFIFILVIHPLVIAQTVNLDSLLTPEEIVWLNNNKHNIRYAPNPSWIPGDYMEDDVHKGIVSDYIKIFEQELGVTFQRVYYQSWAEVIEGLKNSEVDLVGAIQQTTDRDAYLCFTQPFHKSTLGIVVRTNYEHPLTNEHIGTMRLACIENYTSTEYVMQKFPNAMITVYNSDFLALISTSLGKTDGAVVDYMAASHIVNEHGITNLQFGKQLDFIWNLRLASIKQKPHLASILDKLLSTITEEQRKEIANRWIRFDIIEEPSFYDRNKVFVLGAFIILVSYSLLAIIINLYLKKQVRIKTIELVIARDNAIRNEEEARSLFEKHAAVKLIIDPETGNIVDANRAAASFYGWAIDTLKNMNISQINTLPIDTLKKEMSKAQIKQRTIFEFVHRKADGSLVDVEVFSSGIQIGNKEYLHSIVHSISEKKKAEDKLKLLNRAVEASSVSVVIADASGKINYVNPFFTELTEYSLKEVIGKKLRILNPGKLSEYEYDQLWNCIHSGVDWVGEYQNRKKSGKFYWEKSIVSPIMSDTGELSHIVSINENITERKNLLADLVVAKEKAEESNRLKTAFLQNLSHEIRTPMNGILGFTQLLKDNIRTKQVTDIYVDAIEMSSNRLMNLIGDLVDISKIETGQISITTVEFRVNEVLKELYPQFLRLAEEKGLSISVAPLSSDEDYSIVTDRQKVFQILSNLLNNSIKFSEQGNIEFGCVRKGDEIEFYVKDQGVGIPAEKQEAIFERFTQGDISISRGYEGAGLGLSIAKAYVKAMGGNIFVESELGKGSIFKFTLPQRLSSIDQISHDETPQNVKHIREGLSVLIVEDDPTSRMLLKEYLTDLKAIIKFATNGQEAVEVVKSNLSFDFILMDLKMPILNGFEATKQIRELGYSKPIIAQTAYASNEDIDNACKGGFNELISKPINKSTLIEVFSKLEIK